MYLYNKKIQALKPKLIITTEYIFPKTEGKLNSDIPTIKTCAKERKINQIIRKIYPTWKSFKLNQKRGKTVKIQGDNEYV